jgi:hypothetical protein
MKANNMIIEGFLGALQYFGQFDFLLAILAGTIIGLAIGIIPDRWHHRVGSLPAFCLCYPG